MATSTLIQIPVYKINSNQVIDRSLYPYGNLMYFAGASLQVQANSGTTLADLIVQPGGPGTTSALIYSRIRSSTTGDTVFFSNLTPAAIATLANA